MQLSSTLYFLKPAGARASDLAAEVSRLFPGFGGKIEAPGKGSANDNLLRLGDVVIALLDFDLPQPPDALEEAYRVNFAWPEARSEIARHKAHVVLAVIGERNGFEEVRTASHALAMATLALAVMRDTVAAYWSSSMALLKGSSAAAEAETLRDTGLALSLWLAFKPWADPKTGQVGLFTSGLQAFLGREIEMVARKESLFASVERAVALADYLLRHGPVIKDGDTIGYSASERLKITFVEDSAGPLMQVQSEVVQP